jgi:hypothetical protein
MVVPIMVHVQPELIGKAPLRPFNLDLHVSRDVVARIEMGHA